MTKHTYSDIVSQIESLKKEAEKLRVKEQGGVVARIKEAIAAYGLTQRDLFGRVGTKTVVKTKRAKAVSQATKAIKFRDGENTWVGRGPRPQWLRDKIAAGHKTEEFAV